MPAIIRAVEGAGLSGDHAGVAGRAVTTAPGADGRPIPRLVPTKDTWTPLTAWIEHTAEAGHRFSLMDLLIAALADEVGGLVWSPDKDFERLEQPRIVRRYR